MSAKSQALPFLEAPPNCEGYVGNVGFDPFRFSDFAPVDFLREAELKHGRIAMMAWLGYVSVDLGVRVLPVPEALEGVTAATAHDASIEQGGLSQMFLWFGLLEVFEEREGHCRVPKLHREGDHKLGSWVSNQRTKKDSLSPDRIKRLDALGFVWEASKTKSSSKND